MNNINDIENRITFKIKAEYYLKPKTLKLLRSTKVQIRRYENGKNMHYLEIIDVLLFDCNIVNNNNQQNSRVLYTFVPNKSFNYLLDISSKNVIFLKNFDSEFSYVEV